MGKQLSESDARLYRLCDEALFYVWDPVGVNDAPEARDEYWSYLPEVFTLVRAGERDTIVDYLISVEMEQMGVASNRDRAREVADFLLTARDWIEDPATKWQAPP